MTDDSCVSVSASCKNQFAVLCCAPSAVLCSIRPSTVQHTFACMYTKSPKSKLYAKRNLASVPRSSLVVRQQKGICTGASRYNGSTFQVCQLGCLGCCISCYAGLSLLQVSHLAVCLLHLLLKLPHLLLSGGQRTGACLCLHTHTHTEPSCWVLKKTQKVFTSGA